MQNQAFQNLQRRVVDAAILSLDANTSFAALALFNECVSPLSDVKAGEISPEESLLIYTMQRLTEKSRAASDETVRKIATPVV